MEKETEDENTGRQEPEMEQEANLFACLLLMPSQCIKEDIEQIKNGFDLGDGNMIANLAKKYCVPENAMVFRLMYFKEHGY